MAALDFRRTDMNLFGGPAERVLRETALNFVGNQDKCTHWMLTE